MYKFLVFSNGLVKYLADKMKQKLKAIFFDIDDTLYSTTEFVKIARKRSIDAMVKLGLKYPKKMLYKELDEVISEFSSNYPFHYDKLLKRIPKEAFEGINPSILVATAVIAYHKTKWQYFKIYPDAFALLQSLSKVNLIKGIITDGLEVKQAEKIVRLGIYNYLTPSAIFISDQVGISKPNVKLYERVCTVLGLLPQEIMYVGDHPVLDIEPAASLDMITVLCVRAENKFSTLKPKVRPQYIISNFKELAHILKKDFQLKI